MILVWLVDERGSVQPLPLTQYELLPTKVADRYAVKTTLTDAYKLADARKAAHAKRAAEAAARN